MKMFLLLWILIYTDPVCLQDQAFKCFKNAMSSSEHGQELEETCDKELDYQGVMTMGTTICAV
jgi:hypothetical protein